MKTLNIILQEQIKLSKESFLGNYKRSIINKLNRNSAESINTFTHSKGPAYVNQKLSSPLKSARNTKHSSEWTWLKCRKYNNSEHQVRQLYIKMLIHRYKHYTLQTLSPRCQGTKEPVESNKSERKRVFSQPMGGASKKVVESDVENDQRTLNCKVH